MHLEEKTLGVEEIYNGKIIRVTKEQIELENGKQSTREVVYHSGGVCVLPVDNDGNIYLVKQFRYPFKTVLFEIPAGKREAGEEPLACGIRELKEEIGAEAENVVSLGKLYPTVAYDTEVIYMYLATGLSFDETHLDEGEFIDVVKMPFDKAYQMVIDDEIPDAKTQIAILKAKKFYQVK
ncbi:MAG: NUDIX hydrolase [Ruminococcus sp.]|nr:NUDIX hydrolase [Ruminococcus sp.]